MTSQPRADNLELAKTHAMSSSSEEELSSSTDSEQEIDHPLKKEKKPHRHSKRDSKHTKKKSASKKKEKEAAEPETRAPITIAELHPDDFVDYQNSNGKMVKYCQFTRKLEKDGKTLLYFMRGIRPMVISSEKIMRLYKSTPKPNKKEETKRLQDILQKLNLRIEEIEKHMTQKQ